MIQAGQILRGYTVIRELPNESVPLQPKAAVWLARNAAGAEVALKCAAVTDWWQSDQMLVEIDAHRHAARLGHSNILPLVEHGEEGGVVFIMTPFYRPSNRVIYRFPPEVVRMMVQIGSAVQACHDGGLVHCDVYWSNVFCKREPTGWVYFLGDFGSAYCAATEWFWRRWPLPAAWPRTAPETLFGRGDEKSDQYALAGLAYVALAGHMPLSGPIPLAADLKDGFDGAWARPTPLSKHIAVDCEVEAIMMQALAPNPDDRFGSVAEFVDAFAEAVEWAEERAFPKKAGT